MMLYFVINIINFQFFRRLNIPVFISACKITVKQNLHAVKSMIKITSSNYNGNWSPDNTNATAKKTTAVAIF